MPEHDTQPTAEEREAQLAAREAALAAREAELAEREAEAAQASAPRKGSLLNNGDPHFKNEKEKIYDHFPLSVHQMDILIGVLVALIVIFVFLGVNQISFFGSPVQPTCADERDTAREIWRRECASRFAASARFCAKFCPKWGSVSEVRPVDETAS